MKVEIESFEEFAQKHGGNPVELRNRLLFADGAQCGLDAGGFPRKLPPTDDRERFALMKEYAVEMLRRAEWEFNSAKSQFTEAASMSFKYRNLPGPPPNAEQILLALKGAVFLARQKLAEIEQAMADTPQGRRARELERAEQERQAAIAEAHSRISAITL